MEIDDSWDDDEDRYYNLGSHDKLFNQIDQLKDALASREMEVAELKQTCIDRVEIQNALRDQVTLLRDALGPLVAHMELALSSDFDAAGEALAAITDLDGMILCHAEPVGAVLVDKDSRDGVMFYSNDMIQDPSAIKDRFELITVYEAWEPK